MMNESIRRNPWLGLESYQEGEVLYGRDDDIRDLIQAVLNDIETLLYGKSGIGKSSILNAGVIPAARRRGYLPIYIRLSHKENDDYLSQIKRSIIAAMELDESDKDAILDRIRQVVESKDENNESLYEFFHRHTFHDKEGNRIKLLLIFDQFEEIFTLQFDESKKREFFTQLADLLNDIMPAELQESLPVHTDGKEIVDIDSDSSFDLLDDIDLDIQSNLTEYVRDNDIHFVFTIREDFLSEFEYYTASIPSLKHNRYGLRPINDEQASQIILNPIPGLISKPVAKLIIEKVTGRTDFELDDIPEIEVDSAVLSLYLNRLYDSKSEDEITADLVEQKGGQIISDFYNSAISDISESSVTYLENMLINGQGRRDNITVYDAIHDGGVTEKELDILCNKKKILRQFNYAGVLRIEYIHDILCPIVIERKEKRAEDSRINHIKEIARREKLKSRRRLSIAIGALLIMAIGFAGYFWYNWYMFADPVASYYIGYELRNGWPVGIGPELTESQREQLPLHYELSHPGHTKHPYTTVKVCSSNEVIDGQPIIIPLFLTSIIPQDSIPEYMREIQKKIRLVAFSATEASKNEEKPILDNISFYDGMNNLLFTIKPADDSNNKWYRFFDEKGLAMAVDGAYIDRVNVSTNPNGYVKSAIYYDENGVKRPLYSNIYGYTQTETLSDSTFYNQIGSLTITTLNQFGQPSAGKINTTQIDYNPDNIIISYFNKPLTGQSRRVSNKHGFDRQVLSFNQYDYYIDGESLPIASMAIERDKNGNVIHTILNDPKRRLKSLPSSTHLDYDEKGRLIAKEYRRKNGTPFSPDHAIYKNRFNYSDAGELLLHEEYADTGIVYCYRRERLSDNVTATTQGGRTKNGDISIPFHIRLDSILPNNTTVTSYLDLDKNPINFAHDGVSYHKVITCKRGETEEYSYYKIKEGAIIPLDGENVYFRKIRTIDSEGNELTYRTFDKDGNILKSMQFFYEDGRMIGQSALGIDNTPVRCDDWDESGFLYYKMLFNKDSSGDFTDIVVINEFSQPSLLYNVDLGYFNVKYGNFLNCNITPGHSLKSLAPFLSVSKDYWQYYPVRSSDTSPRKATYVHLLNTSNSFYANGHGLKDGDIVVACGHWKNGDMTKILNRELSAGNPMVIMRIEDGKYVKKNIIFNHPITSHDLNSIHFHNMNLASSESQF